MIRAQLNDSNSREESFNRKNIHEEEVHTSHKFSSIGESELNWLAWEDFLDDATKKAVPES
jgi:hypothetical protein